MKLFLFSLVLLMGCGCFASTEEREAATEKLALRAKFEAEERAYSESVSRGVSPEQAKEIAMRAGELAYKAVKDAAAKAPTTGALGQILAGALWLLTNIGLPLLKKKAVEA